VLDLLRTYWPVLVLIYVPALASTLVRVVVTRAMRRLDRSHADDLPNTAGEWLGREIDRLGLGPRVRTLVTDKAAKLSLDGYHPIPGVIQLSAETHFKRDPMHWAIAAHELGHARFRIAWPVLGRIIIAALAINRLLVALAAALALGNIAFALPGVTNLAFLLFAAAAALHLFVLLDECVASLLAMQSLRASSDVSWSHLRSARRMLTLAFSTYVVSFLARTLLLAAWPLVEQLTSEPIRGAAELTALGFVAAAATTAVIVLDLVLHGIALVGRLPARVVGIGAIVALVGKLALAGFVLLVWNHRADPAYAGTVMLALVPVQNMFVLMLTIPMFLVDIFLIGRIARRFAVDPTHRTSELTRDLDGGREQRKSGNRALDSLIAGSQTAVPVEHALLELLRFAHVPLLVAFWLM
jgi:Zn-dependent membrane protease YugP